MDRSGIQQLLFSQQLPNRQSADREIGSDMGRFLFDEPESDQNHLSDHFRADPDSGSEDPNSPRNHFLSSNLDRSAFDEHTVRPSLRQDMRGWFRADPPTAARARQVFHPSGNPTSSALLASSSKPISSLLAAVLQCVDELATELRDHPRFLLAVNTSRREAIARHLEKLAQIHPGPSATSGAADAAAGLRRWIEDPRSEAQTSALQVYCEELAVFTAAQAVLLKAWSDRGIRTLKEDEMSSLNWALASALKPHVPLDREGWSVTRNLYSWFTPPNTFQGDLWRILADSRVTDEGPDLLLQLVRLGRKTSIRTENDEYDERFLSGIWQLASRLGLQEEAQVGPLRRKRSAFSPTLRDGSMVRTGPVSWSWMGLEANPFLLATAELAQLWWGPSAPPLWSSGTGLEVHPRDQLSLSLGTMKPSLHTRMSDNESCDLAVVLEERTVRAQGRSCEAQRFREQLEVLPYFRRLKGPNTCLGALQACTALTRLRPGGFLIWAREAPLGSGENAETLHFLLEHGALRAEWSFTELAHSLPGKAPITPRYLYLFQREPEMRQRLSNRPRRITVQGQVKSHIEVPQMIEDALSAVTLGAPNEVPLAARGSWQAHVQISPVEQKDWIDHWPDLSDPGVLSQLESLRLNSCALAAFSTIRATPPGDPKRGGMWALPASSPAIGFWVQATEENGRRRLVTAPLPRLPDGVQGSGVQVLVRDSSWVAPLCAYLESGVVAEWLDLHCERRGEQWLLQEAAVRLIPVPMPLLHLLGASDDPQGRAFATPLPGEWERLAADIGLHPRRAKEALPALEKDPRFAGQSSRIRSTLFVRVARLIEQTRLQHGKLFSLVRANGEIKWRELFQILPPTELIPAARHPQLKISGTLPGQMIITKITRVKAPTPGYMLASDSGLNLHLGLAMGAHKTRLLEMLDDQLEGISHVTWSELSQYLRLPRSVELADEAASDILRAHGEQSRLLQDLRELLFACSRF